MCFGLSQVECQVAKVFLRLAVPQNYLNFKNIIPNSLMYFREPIATKKEREEEKERKKYYNKIHGLLSIWNCNFILQLGKL